MTAKDNGSLPAVGVAGIYDLEGRPLDTIVIGGLTKREAFAMAAMQGILASGSVPPSTTHSNAELVADGAASCADALLAELAKEG